MSAVRQTKYSRLAETDGGRAADYDVTEHCLTAYTLPPAS